MIELNGLIQFAPGLEMTRTLEHQRFGRFEREPHQLRVESMGASQADRVVVTARLCVEIYGLEVFSLELELPGKVIRRGAITARSHNLGRFVQVALSEFQREDRERGGEEGGGRREGQFNSGYGF